MRSDAVLPSLPAPRSDLGDPRELGAVAFLRRLRGPVVLVWDNLGVHKGRLVKQLCRRLPRLDLEYLPAYTPGINPHEGVCRHTQDRLTNGGPAARFELALSLVEELEALRRSRDRLWSCITHSGLAL